MVKRLGQGGKDEEEKTARREKIKDHRKDLKDSKKGRGSYWVNNFAGEYERIKKKKQEGE